MSWDSDSKNRRAVGQLNFIATPQTLLNPIRENAANLAPMK